MIVIYHYQHHSTNSKLTKGLPPLPPKRKRRSGGPGVEQLERMNAALIALRHSLLPGQPRKFAILAEGPLEEIRRRRDEIERLTGTFAAMGEAAA